LNGRQATGVGQWMVQLNSQQEGNLV